MEEQGVQAVQTIQGGKTASRRRRRRIGTLLIVLLAVILAAGIYLSLRPNGMAHYLLIGVDGWGVNTQGAGRSDVVMLATLDYDRNRVLLTSFARDSLVSPEGGTGDLKLNTLVRRQAGEQGLVDYLEKTYAIDIGGYFVVNFSGAVDIIDAVGGVSVELTGEEVVYLRSKAGDYDNYPLHEGLCRLNGAQALAYMRCRKLDNDFGRQNRQGNVLRAVKEELVHITPGRALALLNSMEGMYRTDLTGAQQMELAKNAVHLRRAEIEKHSIPAEGTYGYGQSADGASGLKWNLEKNLELFASWIGAEPALPAQAQVERQE